MVTRALTADHVSTDVDHVDQMNAAKTFHLPRLVTSTQEPTFRPFGAPKHGDKTGFP